MNIANPCKFLFLASTLAFSFAIRADGTLPFPLEGGAQVEFPLLMGGLSSEKGLDGVIEKQDISMSLDNLADEIDDVTVSDACKGNKTLTAGTAKPTPFPASGSVQVGDDLFEIKAFCAPKTGDKRSVIATKAGRLLQLDGSFKVSALTKKLNFKGSALKIDTVSTSPESGETVKPTISFEMDQLPLD